MSIIASFAIFAYNCDYKQGRIQKLGLGVHLQCPFLDAEGVEGWGTKGSGESVSPPQPTRGSEGAS